MASLERRVRERLQHHLSPEVASHAGLSVQDLQRFVSIQFAPTLGGGGVTLTDAQLLTLARRMRLT